MRTILYATFCLIAPFLAVATGIGETCAAEAPLRPRVLISTDIGGTDPDDFQSLVHLLVYADCFDLEGLISSPYGPGRKQHILQVIDRYEQDYPNLRTHSPRYPTPEALRDITKQGALESAGVRGFRKPTEGSNWIANCARRQDDRPLHILIWGGIDDLAQALHDSPDILANLRVYFIGGPNKMWSVNAYNYIEENHPNLWIIEANSTYRGWFVGGNQQGDLGNKTFVSTHIAGHGALGDFFASQLGGTLKMGDSPSVGWLLHGDPADPSQPGWGGQFVRVWDDRKTIFRRTTTESDEVEAFGITEFQLPLPAGMTAAHTAKMLFDNRISLAMEIDGHILRCLFSPRDAKLWTYSIQSDWPVLHNQTGQFTAVPPPSNRTTLPSTKHPHWWTDDPNPSLAEGIHAGAKTVNRWREQFLTDFASRLRRCKAPAAP